MTCLRMHSYINITNFYKALQINIFLQYLLAGHNIFMDWKITLTMKITSKHMLRPIHIEAEQCRMEILTDNFASSSQSDKQRMGHPNGTH